MPSVFMLFYQGFSKSEWKRLLNNSINSYVEASWKAEVETKSSLKYVNPDILKVGQSHPVWSTVRCNIMDNKRAQSKCKLLTGTYISCKEIVQPLTSIQWIQRVSYVLWLLKLDNILFQNAQSLNAKGKSSWTNYEITQF